jgi:hypothetical protein
MKMSSLGSKRTVAVTSLVAAALVWLPVVHFLFRPATADFYAERGIAPKAQEMAARHLALWTDPQGREAEISAMRRSNAEWDFMGRTFLVLSLAEMCLRESARKEEYLPVIDRIIDETLRLEQERDVYFFLMPYARARPYQVQPVRSLFLDGEIALMLAVRRVVEEEPRYRTELASRIRLITERLQQNPVMAVESYPDECWLFDHTMALAALRLSTHLDGHDHSELLRQWLVRAKEKLVDPTSGLLISSYTTRAEPLDGPEASSLWCAAHCLQLVDADFARQQYEGARKLLKRELAGFAWSREWPASWQGPLDVDSGAVIPGLDVSAGGSGLAFVGAASFHDEDYLRRLHTTIDFAGFPKRAGGALRYCASNQVGDSVLLYSMVLGPIWEKVLQRKS